MSSAYGPDGPIDHDSRTAPVVLRQTLEVQLFESLVHHLIEKGLLTRNDALSVVQTVAQVARGTLEEGKFEGVSAGNDLAILKRLYSSLELVRDRPSTSQAFDDGNVFQLRPPLHGGRPKFEEN